MEPYYVTFLKSQLEAKKKKNSRFSLRAFAGHLALDPSTLSRILLGKQRISVAVAEKVVGKLTMSKQEIEQFLASVADEKRSKIVERFACDLGPEWAPNNIRCSGPLASMTIALDPERLNVASKILHDFAVEVCNSMGASDRVQLYRASVSLSPVEAEPAASPPELAQNRIPHEPRREEAWQTTPI